MCLLALKKVLVLAIEMPFSPLDLAVLRAKPRALLYVRHTSTELDHNSYIRF